MDDIAIITDSTSDLTDDFIKKHNIRVIPLQINYENKTFRDRLEINYEQIYKNIDKEIPTTSLPFASDVVEVFENLKKENIKNVLGMFISSGLSGTYNLINHIAKDYYDCMNVKIIETKTISMGIGHAIIQSTKAIELGKTFEEVVKVAQNTLKNTRTFFALSTLTYLVKGGRLGKVSGTIGNMLNLKPIIGVDEIETGQYYTIKKIRGKNNVIKGLYEIVQKLIRDKKTFDIAIADAIAEDEKNIVASMIEENKNISTFINTSVTPVIAVHTGPGLIGISIHCEEGLDDLRTY